MKQDAIKPLFTTNLPGPEWVEFEAEGFSRPVNGVIYRDGEAVHGMPLGGIGTGYVNLDTDGTLGRCTMFNTFVPPREIGGIPFLGLAVDGRTWVLALKGIEGVENVSQIHYWGHYPVADLEYETDAPVSVGLRAWTPFLPGDSAGSNTPGAVFEVRLRNVSGAVQEGTIAFSFPGPSEAETMGECEYERKDVNGGLGRVVVKCQRPAPTRSWRGDLEVSYALCVVGAEKVRHGGELGANGKAWSRIISTLPEAGSTEPGVSVAADFSLQPGESKSMRLVLACYAPRWQAQQWDGSARARRIYIHRYATRFESALEVAEYLACNHETLLQRIVGWQQAIYAEEELPDWLRDSLVNIFHIIAQNSCWVNPVPRGSTEEHWFGPEGIFSINESLVSCPQPSCIPCEWLGSLPILFFFPDLALLNLRAFMAYQRFNGEVPFYFGQGTDMESPLYGQEAPTNGSEYAQLVDRLWQSTGDDGVLQEFYRSVKAGINFMKELDKDGDGLPDCEGKSHFYDAWNWYGATTPVVGFWLATLRVVEQMAEKVGDHAFAHDCRIWYEWGSRSLEEKLWNEEAGSYLLYNQPETGRRSDTVFSDQMVGQWVTYFHGMPGVFPPDRVNKVLSTLERLNVAATPHGIICGLRPDGSRVEEWAYDGIHPSMGALMPALVMIYTGEGGFRELGVEVARRCWHNMVIWQGMAWNMPGILNPDQGYLAGEDYYHNTSLWALPAAILGQDVKSFCAPGGVVDRILKAAQLQRPGESEGGAQ